MTDQKSTPSSFDVIVIGGGPGGYVCAIRAAQLGLKTACIESRGALGGTCLNVGCIPSKALLESSHLYEKAGHEFEDHGIKIKDLSFDMKTLQKRKEKIVSTLTGGVEFLFKKNKITYLKGHGKITGKNSVEVIDTEKNSQTYEAKHIVIATGSAPIELKDAPFGEHIVSSTEALEFKKPPKHLIVVGGGVIGMELGSVWKRLGSKVTVIEAGPQLLGTTDQEVSKTALRSFQKMGFDIHLQTFLKKAEVSKDQVTVTCEKDGKTESFKGDKVLISVGRKPHTENLGLENISVQPDPRGRIPIDKKYKVPGHDHIYALGDVVEGPMLAHKAEDEGVAVAEIIAGKFGHVNYEAIPSVVYTHPEIASCGATEEQLKEAGVAYNKGKFLFKPNGRAMSMGEADGFVKILADAKTDRLLGFHIIGPQASELIAEAALAFEFGASAEDIARTVHAHPTLAEVTKEAAMAVDKRALHG